MSHLFEKRRGDGLRIVTGCVLSPLFRGQNGGFPADWTGTASTCRTGSGNRHPGPLRPATPFVRGRRRLASSFAKSGRYGASPANVSEGAAPPSGHKAWRQTPNSANASETNRIGQPLTSRNVARAVSLKSSHRRRRGAESSGASSAVQRSAARFSLNTVSKSASPRPPRMTATRFRSSQLSSLIRIAAKRNAALWRTLQSSRYSSSATTACAVQAPSRTCPPTTGGRCFSSETRRGCMVLPFSVPFRKTATSRAQEHSPCAKTRLRGCAPLPRTTQKGLPRFLPTPESCSLPASKPVGDRMAVFAAHGDRAHRSHDRIGRDCQFRPPHGPGIIGERFK